jgi:nitroreductase
MLDILRKRRSIRRYLDQEIDRPIIEQLKEAALRSPSSRGINPWSFFFITDRDRLEKLSFAKEHGSEFLRGARLGVVICADSRKTDVWIEDCSIASIILQLTGCSLGLGSCWIQIRNRMHNQEISAEDYVRDVLDLPEHLRVESIMSFGYPDEVKEPIGTDHLDWDQVSSLD